MTTTTTTKRERTEAKAPSLAERKANEQRELLAAAEEAGFDIAAGQPLNGDHQVIFDALGWDRLQVEMHVGRCGSVRRHQAAAGTATERVVAAEASRKADASLTTEAARLEEEIRERQARVDELRRAADAARRRVDHQTQAVANLRGLVPPHVRAAVDLQLATLTRTPEAERLRAVEQFLNTARGVVKVRFSEQREVVLMHCEAARPDLVRREAVGEMTRRAVSEDDWRRYIAELESAMPEAEQELAALKAKCDAAVRDVEKALDVYVR